jgi:hypothetical protein
VLAACFRSGAIYLERQTATGPSPVYDYKGAADLFLKITSFKKATFRVAETSLSVEQIKAASKALISMGVSGTPESGNAIAGAVRELGETLQTGLTEAKSRATQGLPIDDAVLGAEGALTKPLTAKDPTAAVTEFLAEEAAWKALFDGLADLNTFVGAGRHEDFSTSRKLVDLVDNHAVPEDHADQAKLEQALKDMDALIADKTVIGRWADYRLAYEQARDVYRTAYLEVYEAVRTAAKAAVAAIKAGDAYAEAPTPKRDTVVEAVFGVGKPCHYPSITLPTTKTLLDACAKRSLTSLQQAAFALPGYRNQVEAALRDLVVPPPPPDETWEWRPGNDFAGKRLSTEEAVDSLLSSVGDELKSQIRKGLVVVVK